MLCVRRTRGTWKTAALRHALVGRRSDPEIAFAAMAQDHRALEYAATQLKGDRGFVLAAVTQEAHALQYAKQELRTDREVVLVAVFMGTLKNPVELVIALD